MNFFSLFSMERICRITPWNHPWLLNQKPSARDYLKRVDWSKWKDHAGIALVMYAMVQRQFGWDTFAATMNKISSTLPDHASEQDKMDIWVKTLSLHTLHNLIPFHKAWGMPLSAKLQADAEVVSLPVWGDNPAALMDAA